MAFFKFRKGGDDSPAAPAQPETVEVLRRRARHRLIGAAVLVLLGVIGFPLLFDTQPRPVAVDIPIEIPDRNKAKPLPAVQPAPKPSAEAAAAAPEHVAAAKPSAPAASATGRPVAAGAITVASEPAKAEPLKTEPPKAEAKVEPAKPVATASKPAPAASKPEHVAKADPAAKPAADAARAQALLEGKVPEAKPASTGDQPAAAGRFIVQVGAFADVAKARETRLKVEKAGLKTYTHVAETKDGKRIRVRVGPFPTRAEADKAAGRIKDLDLPAAILTL